MMKREAAEKEKNSRRETRIPVNSLLKISSTHVRADYLK